MSDIGDISSRPRSTSSTRSAPPPPPAPPDASSPSSAATRASSGAPVATPDPLPQVAQPAAAPARDQDSVHVDLGSGPGQADGLLAALGSGQPPANGTAPAAAGQPTGAVAQTQATGANGAPQRTFAAGSPITPDAIEQSGMAGNQKQLNLERNSLYRDANPQAYFKTPGLNDSINQMTGTQGDPTDPANAATNVNLSPTQQQSADTLKNYEATAKIAQWRADNPDKIQDTGFPPPLSPDSIASATSAGTLQDATNTLYAERGAPLLSDANVQKFGSISAYQPNPRFDENTAFSPQDQAYIDQLVARRQQLSAN